MSKSRCVVCGNNYNDTEYNHEELCPTCSVSIEDALGELYDKDRGEGTGEVETLSYTPPSSIKDTFKKQERIYTDDVDDWYFN